MCKLAKIASKYSIQAPSRQNHVSVKLAQACCKLNFSQGCGNDDSRKLSEISRPNLFIPCIRITICSDFEMNMI